MDHTELPDGATGSGRPSGLPAFPFQIGELLVTRLPGEEAAPPTRIRVSGTCRVTGQRYAVETHLEGVLAWVRGRLIQNALPELGIEDREFLVSRISPKGWTQLFGSVRTSRSTGHPPSGGGQPEDPARAVRPQEHESSMLTPTTYQHQKNEGHDSPVKAVQNVPCDMA